MSDFKKLEVWEKAHALALDANEVAQRIRGSQYSSMRSQIIRAAISIAANIVEGREQESEKDFLRFLRYSKEQVTRLRKMLSGLIARIGGLSQ